jgi:translocation and assembly module TamB
MKLLRRGLMLLLLLLLIVAIALYFVVRSDWFSEQIRTRIVDGIEKATGGKTELKAFRFDPNTWNVSVQDLTLHGTEAATEPPLVHVKTATVGWKLISIMDRKFNVLSIDVDSPEVFLRHEADGRWNLPRTNAPPSAITPFDRLIDLKAGRLRVTNGLVRLDDRKIPLAFEARDAEVTLSAITAATSAEQAYMGSAKASKVHLTRPFFTPIDAGLETELRMDHSGLQFTKGRVTFGGSLIRTEGRMVSWTMPRLEATAEGEVLLADLKRPLKLPLEPRGQAKFKSKWAISTTNVDGDGTVNGTGLDWTIAGIRVAPFTADADWSIRHKPGATDEMRLDNAVVGLLGGTIAGTGKVTAWRDFEFEGEAKDLASARLYSLYENREFPWSATMAGPVSGHGRFPTLTAAKADLTITRAEGATPVDGRVTFDYDVAARRLTFAPSRVELARSRAEFSGDGATRLEVQASTSNLDELIPAVRFFAGRDVRVPVTLDGSEIKLSGVVTNRTDFAGTVDAGKFGIRDTAYSGTFDGFRSAVAADANGLRLDNFRLQQQATALTGSLRTAWANGTLRESDAISGRVQVTALDLARVLRESGTNALPAEAKLAGMANANLQLSGTVGTPVVAGDVRVSGGTAWGIALDRFSTGFRWSREQLMVDGADVASGRSSARISGDYRPTTADWRSGRARFDLNANEGSMRRWVAALPEGFEAAARGTAKGEMTIRNGVATLAALDGTVTIPQLTLNGRPLGDAQVEASSRGSTMTTKLNARLLGSQVQGNAEFSLNGNNPGLGQAQVTGLTLENLRTLGIFGDVDKPLPARGSLDAELGFSGPVFRPDQWTATIKIPRLAIEPRPASNTVNGTTIDPTRFSLRNTGPLTGTVDRRGLTIETARLVGQGTDLTIGGSIGLRTRAPWNLTMKGSFNLDGLSVLEPDLEASGVSTLDATVRGELYRPAINGQMEITDASFRFRNVPNGLDQVSGLIRFDTNRATIERLTAQSGGGNLSVTGFVGFGGPQLVYRLQSDVKRVRVRYPDEVSTTFDGKLAMSGTSAQSLLSGDITLARVSLQAQTDLGGLLAATARSAQSTPTQNAFLRGMQLDVHVVTAPDAQLQTSLARDLQPQADLRIRGTAARPVALGRTTISEGDLTFFGNRYRVNRGEINLYNPSRIEPVLNFDLETTVRGVIVNINVSGPMDKLNVNYRSDPPLQQSEIVSLLAVGLGPNTASTSQTTTTNTSAVQQTGGGGSLLGGAISSTLAAPVAGRLQRLFGISRVNIDPDLNSTSPQGRLTVEQQVSREIRLTYITTLSRTQNLIVRMQWDFSQDFSLIAIRDENGLFGVDFQIRKRFK